MAHLAVHAVAVTDKAIGARRGLQHVGEVFRAHGGLLLGHVVSTDDAGHDIACKGAFSWMVDGGRIVALKLKRAGGAKGGAGVLRDVAHALLDHVEHLDAEGAHRALQLAVVGHHVGGLAGVDHGDRDHARIHRLFVATDDGLERLHHLARHQHGVDAVVWQRGVAALAVDGDLELVARGHDGASAQGELPLREARPVVHAVDGLHGELLEQTITNHLARTAAALFCRLEDEVHRAVKVLVLGEVLRRSQQHGHMAVVAASVHLARVLAGVGELVELLHGQRVHVRAQANGFVAAAVLQDTHHARFAHAAVDGNAPLGQFLSNQISGANFFKAQLGVGVDIAADGGDGGSLLGKGIKDFHSLSLA